MFKLCSDTDKDHSIMQCVHFAFGLKNYMIVKGVSYLKARLDYFEELAINCEKFSNVLNRTTVLLT